MTAPVLTSFTNSQPGLINANSFCNVSMSFYVPKDVQANVPKPVDSAVKIEAAGEVRAILADLKIEQRELHAFHAEMALQAAPLQVASPSHWPR